MSGPIAALFNVGEVRGKTLPIITANLTAQKVADMIEAGHPIGNKAREKGIEPAEAVRGMGVLGISDLIAGYLGEKEINPNLKLADSVSMKHFLSEIEDNASVLVDPYLDIAILKRSLPSILQASFDEAKKLIQTVVQEKAAQRGVA